MKFDFNISNLLNHLHQPIFLIRDGLFLQAYLCNCIINKWRMSEHVWTVVGEVLVAMIRERALLFEGVVAR
jgi:hypothetical protein